MYCTNISRKDLNNFVDQIPHRDFINELTCCVESGAVKSSTGIMAVTTIIHTIFAECSGLYTCYLKTFHTGAR